MLVLTIITWVLSALLALAMLMAGGLKVLKTDSAREMVTLGVRTPATVRFIGLAEIAGALALVIAPLFAQPIAWLAPAGAVGLALIQFLAIFAHKKHDEPFSKNIVLMLFALVVAVLAAVTI